MTTQDYQARILVVEDDPHIQLLLRHFLQPCFDVAFANSLDNALETAAHHVFDLFFLDIHMKERRTGVDLLGALRQMPASRATPAIACTAYALAGDRDRFLALGFCGYLEKPFMRETLFETIQQALAGAPPIGEFHALPASSQHLPPIVA